MASSGNESPSWVQVALRIGFFSLRQRTIRRKVMFYVSLAAMAQLAIGLVALEWLSQTVLLFLFFWGFCSCLVLLMLLLALYDILAVRQEQQLELRRLRDQVFGESVHDSTLSSHADDPRDSGEA